MKHRTSFKAAVIVFLMMTVTSLFNPAHASAPSCLDYINYVDNTVFRMWDPFLQRGVALGEPYKEQHPNNEWYDRYDIK